MWTYAISTGVMRRGDAMFQGYSGAGHSLLEGRNNPSMIGIPNRGPIPFGSFKIGAPYDSPQTGPYTMPLYPDPNDDMYGRSEFRIHGNNAANDASHGCIILPPDARRAVWMSGDHDLRVIA